MLNCERGVPHGDNLAFRVVRQEKSREALYFFFFCYLVPQASNELEDTTVSNFQQEFVSGCHYKTSHVEPTPTIDDHDYICTTDVPVLAVEDMLLAAQERIHELENKLCQHNAHPLYVQLHTRPDETKKFYTGFPSFQILCATFQVIQPTAAKMFSWSQLQRLRNKGTGKLIN